MYNIEDRFGNPDKTVTTTDGTQTIIDEYTLDDDKTCIVQVYVVGIQDDGSERCSVIKSACVYRENGGSATIQGSVPGMLESFSDNAWSVDIIVSGNDVRATVTGVAATTISWKCAMQFMD